MNKKYLLIASFSFLPVFAFAATGSDSTFGDITTQLTAYLGGSLGMLFVLMGFLGAAAAVAGFASMKVMFPVFGLTLALRYGPKILVSVFGATGDYFPMVHHASEFAIYDLVILMLATVVVVFGFERARKNNQTNGKA